MRKLIVLFLVLCHQVSDAQQFNSDNYITMPHGTGTFVLTAGERNSTMYAIFALAPRFELNVQTTLFRQNEGGSPNRFTTNFFGKYMFWVNEQKNGGAAIFLGMGRAPGYFSDSGYSNLHQNYWTALPVTIPFFKGVLTWDIMPGALVDFDHGENKNTAWGFTYSTRMALYKVIPRSAIVAEIFGTTGEASSPAEYKIGIRWEPNDYIIPAISYGHALNGTKAAGFEIGVMIFTPQFLKKDFIKKNHIVF